MMAVPNQIGLSYRVLDSFFDRPAVIRAVERAQVKNLSKAGAFVRQSARRSIRKRKKHAEPGTPPSSHAGQLRRGIVFAYDKGAESVVIGPLRYNMDGGMVPNVLEFGGDLVKYWRLKDGRMSRRARRGRKRREVWHYKAFPYMGPALERERPNFPDLWSNTVGN